MDKRRIKIFVCIIGLLWVAAFTQMMVNEFFMKEERIMEAFASTGTKVEESSLEMTADYGNKALSKDDKELIIRKIADKIGLDNNYDIEEKKVNDTVSMIAEKHGKNAKTIIEIITIFNEVDSKRKHYILVSLNIFEKTNSIIQYKQILEESMEEIEVTELESLIRFHGFCEGKLTENERDVQVKEMLKNIQAKVVNEYSEDGLLNVYAYTGLLKEYLKVNRKRINVNVVVTYNEIEDRTYIYLATPILNGDY
jgi:hypothetical protein